MNFAEHGNDDPINGGTLKGPTIKGKRIIRPRITAPQEKGLEPIWPEFAILFGGRMLFNGFFEFVNEQTGGIHQWIRFGKSFSSTKNAKTSLSLRWGTNKHYRQKIGNKTLRKFNQKLRETRIPIKSWRTDDPGHLHILLKK